MNNKDAFSSFTKSNKPEDLPEELRLDELGFKTLAEELTPEEAIPEKTNDEKIEREVVTKDEERTKAEVLSNPQKIWVNPKQLKILLENHEAVLTNVHLRGRKLELGERVVLIDDQLKEIDAEVVETNTNSSGNSSIKVKL